MLGFLRMRVRRLTIRNFRGVESGVLDFRGHTLLVGGNNAGKSTVCEALDLVLGPERLYRRPPIDEHDFHRGQYLDAEGTPVEIRIEAILVDLSEEALRRFTGRVRRWNDNTGTFVDEDHAAGETDDTGTMWALPVLFVGRYDPKEDDFEAETFFAHPQDDLEQDDPAAAALGAGLTKFSRDSKRLCGFVFLRALRTGSRAMSLQRGSLLDTILRSGEGSLHRMWLDTLQRLRSLEPAIGDLEQLKLIRAEIQERMQRFVPIGRGEEATAFFASDLTRQHLREVVSFFVASEQSGYSVPFQRLGTGTINTLVFALLTFIAELKQHQSVVFAMEEPEIALPPHTQRRIARFVLREMGQAIVTSHSPYVIEQFEPEQIVMLDRVDGGRLSGSSVDTSGTNVRAYKVQRRQFAEAVLSRAVLVLEGATETSLFMALSSAMEEALQPDEYSHLDLAGVTLFNAGADTEVPKYGPVFKSLGKLAFAFYDEPRRAFSAEDQERLTKYDHAWASPHRGIEDLLVDEVPGPVLRRFLEAAADRSDYPQEPRYNASLPDEEVKDLTRRVLRARKGDAYAYAAFLIEHCGGLDDLPATLVEVLMAIHASVSAVADDRAGACGTDQVAAED